MLLPGLGVAFIAAVWLSIWLFGKPMKASFSRESRTQIELIAQRICTAAGERDCSIAWSGKHKWFGQLHPSSLGLAKAGLSQVRQALVSPPWFESAQSDGITFSDGKFEVFVSSQSGTISISSVEESPR